MFFFINFLCVSSIFFSLGVRTQTFSSTQVFFSAQKQTNDFICHTFAIRLQFLLLRLYISSDFCFIFSPLASSRLRRAMLHEASRWWSLILPEHSCVEQGRGTRLVVFMSLGVCLFPPRLVPGQPGVRGGEPRCLVVTQRDANPWRCSATPSTGCLHPVCLSGQLSAL